MAESHENSDIEKLKERALKITEALYRSTDIMFDGEPLKWSLRQSALEIMNIVSGLHSSGQVSEVSKVDKLLGNLFLKLELASSGTYISKMNFEVLKREYSALNFNILEQSKTPILLDMPAIRQVPQSYRTSSDILDKISDKAEMSETIDSSKLEEKEEVVEVDRKDRKSVIVSALKNNGPSSISDVAKLFNGEIGEKTVQRELNSLVEIGTIRKEGEKRWRRYFL